MDNAFKKFLGQTLDNKQRYDRYNMQYLRKSKRKIKTKNSKKKDIADEMEENLMTLFGP